MSLLWDQHACLPLQVDADVDDLLRFGRPGTTLVSVNVGYSPQSFADSMALVHHFRSAIERQSGLAAIAGVDELETVSAAGDIAVVFDLEDSGPLDGDLANLHTLAQLGVRTMLPSYNHANRAGCGCLDAVDTGLTSWGRRLVAEMNDVGVVPDGSHCSVATGLDMCATSSKPVIYSHSCMQSVWITRAISPTTRRAPVPTPGEWSASPASESSWAPTRRRSTRWRVTSSTRSSWSGWRTWG